MPTRNVVLTDYQDSFVDSMVGSGRYQNASEVLRDGLRLVERQQVEYAERLADLRQAVQTGFDSVIAGEFTMVPTEQAGAHVASLRERAEQRLAARATML
jgi:antitoxin ParD1/3/4